MTALSDSPAPPHSALTLAHVVYALHGFAILVGVVGSVTVVGSFVGSVPSIIAVIINYAKRSDARGTWLESHYSWQIRTFWYALLWAVLGVVAALTIIGIPVAIAIFIGLTLWVVYRIARGWLRLLDRRAMPF